MPVSIVNCASYAKEEVKASVDRLLDGIGGLKKYVPQGAKVLIKANLLRAAAPERATTTHPVIIEVLAEKLIAECGAEVTVGDSPGGVYNASFLSGVYRATKMREACANSGARLNEDFGSEEVLNPEGKVMRKISCINAFLKADVVINVAKLKAHMLTGCTACVKNLFGLIPGLEKVGLHSRFEDLPAFCDCLIDLERFASPKTVLHMIDAVVGMHKEGPAAGDPIELNRIIASDNAYHADVVAACVIGSPSDMPVLQKAVERGLLKKDFSDVPYDLASIERNKDFQGMPKLRASIVPKPFRRIVRTLTTKKALIAKNCTGCNTCVRHCPKETIIIKKGKAKIIQRNCIRCYCCHELCPFFAVKLKNPLIKHGRKAK